MHNPAIFHVVIPCAGSGSRSGMKGPKQYTLLAGQPLVVHTLRAFSAIPGFTSGVVVVAPDDQQMKKVLFDHPQPNFVISNSGGQTRAESVLAGLRALQQSGVEDQAWVLIHDAARCLITPELITNLIETCQVDSVGGLLALPLPDTLKSGQNGRVQLTLDRQDKWLAQTPQMFRLGKLSKAIVQAGDSVTDEAGAMESLGLHPILVKGASFNFKVTYPEDADLANAILVQRQQLKTRT